MSNTILRDRLICIINNEGINQKHIAQKTNINEGLLSRFKNRKCELGLLDRESLDEFLISKGY